MSETAIESSSTYALTAGMKDFQFLYFLEMQRLPVCTGDIHHRIGRVDDVAVRLAEPYPEATGICIEHGWGKPAEFIPWDKVIKIDDDAVFVQPPPNGEAYSPFVDQPGWILIDHHLMGKTILDIDGRTTEVVNDVHFLESNGRMLLVHVDVSLNGWLRRWGIRRLRIGQDRLISWKHVQPFSLEDVGAKDVLSLSVTRKQMRDLPSEDLADALEELSGVEQQALFSALDSEKAAETLMEAEPRAQRQLIADLRQERAKAILSEMSMPQLADLFSVLPHDDTTKLRKLLPRDLAKKVDALLGASESTAEALMTRQYFTGTKDECVGDALRALKASGLEPALLSYVYVVSPENVLIGVVDLREIVLASEDGPLERIMTSPVVSVDTDDTRTDLAELFAKYHYRMVPVVDSHDHLVGVIQYNEIMKGLVTRAKL